MKGIVVSIGDGGVRKAHLVHITKDTGTWLTCDNGMIFHKPSGIRKGESKKKIPTVIHHEYTLSYKEAVKMHKRGSDYWKVEGL